MIYYYTSRIETRRTKPSGLVREFAGPEGGRGSTAAAEVVLFFSER